MSEGKIRWGVLSTANIGRVAVIPAIRASANGELVAVASRDQSRAEDFAGKLSIPRAYGSYQALVEAEDIDALYNPLPNSLHREWTIRAAERGKHVLCEKPLGCSAAECDEMGEAADQAGVLLMEAFMYRFHPRTELVVKLVRDGVVGPPRSIQASFTFRLRDPDNIRLDPELGGGALMDVGCYCVNISRTLAGAEPVEAQAFAHWSRSGVDEQIAGTLIFESGLFARIDAALTLERHESYQVAGPEGQLLVASAFLPGTDETVVEELRGRGERKVHTVAGDDEYRLMVEHFADSILSGGALRYPASEGAANMRAIEALYRSARNGGRPEAV